MTTVSPHIFPAVVLDRFKDGSRSHVAGLNHLRVADRAKICKGFTTSCEVLNELIDQGELPRIDRSPVEIVEPEAQRRLGVRRRLGIDFVTLLTGNKMTS